MPWRLDASRTPPPPLAVAVSARGGDRVRSPAVAVGRVMQRARRPVARGTGAPRRPRPSGPPSALRRGFPSAGDGRFRRPSGAPLPAARLKMGWLRGVTAHTADICARVRADHSVASRLGCAARDREVLALRGRPEPGAAARSEPGRGAGGLATPGLGRRTGGSRVWAEGAGPEYGRCRHV